MSNTYIPPQGSCAYRVCMAVLQVGALREDAIAADERKSTAFVSSVLADAVTAGLLTRRRDESRGIVYGKGPNLSPAALDPDAQPLAEAAANLLAAKTAPAVDISTIGHTTRGRGGLATSPAPAPAVAQEAPVRKKPGVPHGSKRSVLPELDLSSIRVTLAPKVDHHAKKAPGETKWGPLFDKMAAISITDDKLPTVEMPALYGKALQAAARSYSISTGGRVKFRVALGKTKCTVQRIA
jgi:hypothetical protein